MTQEDRIDAIAVNPFSTGGGGTTFELGVAATYLSFLLCGQPPVGMEGVTARVSLQTKWQGTPLDDIAVLTDVGGGRQRRLYIAVRHSIRLAEKDRNLAEVVRAAWQTFVGQHCPFDPVLDRVAVVFGSELPNRDALRALLRTADASASAEEFDRRMSVPHSVSQDQRRIRDVLRGTLAGIADEVRSEDFWQFLRCFRVLRFDFGEGDGAHSVLCRVVLKQVVQDGDHDAAARLFDLLCRQAGQLAREAATVDRDGLWQRVVNAGVRLRDREDYSNDLERLREHREILMRRIMDRLVGQVHVPRVELTERLRGSAATNLVTVVNGEPGAGKSALLKGLVSELARQGEVFAFDAGEGASDVVATSGLQHSFTQILRATAAASRWLVIDGVEGVMGSVKEQRALTDKLTGLMDLNESLSSEDNAGKMKWRVVLGCRAEEWGNLLPLFPTLLKARQDGQLAEVTVPGFTDGELDRVAEEMPRLKAILADSRLRDLLRRPFYLDAILRREAAVDTGKISGPISEVWLMDWFWSDIVRRNEGARPGDGTPSEREALLIMAACGGITTGEPWFSESDADGAALQGLSEERLLQMHQGRARIVHDTIADWALARLMIRQEHQIADTLDELKQAYRLNRPFTLLALHALEYQGSLDRWMRLLDTVGGDARLTPRWRRLALLAPPSSVRLPYLAKMLERAYFSGDGRLLSDTVNALRTERTVPDPRLPELARAIDITDEAELRSLGDYVRFPVLESWIPLLRLVVRNADTIPEASEHEVALAIRMWMKTTPHDWPLRQDLTNLAISMYRRRFPPPIKRH